ncbi:hypothetical protein [Nonomuraea insulae]|uniref:Secreted protein n=1 Tax=Nonomuraea insulae TaxID=1616787 RepID=A0ABW1CNZ6_9ACTN
MARVVQMAPLVPVVPVALMVPVVRVVPIVPMVPVVRGVPEVRLARMVRAGGAVSLRCVERAAPKAGGAPETVVWASRVVCVGRVVRG